MEVQSEIHHSKSDPDEGLKREIGVLGVASNTLNSIIGGGIFVLPAAVALILGKASIIAYVICAVLILFIMLCFAEIGSKVISTGGAYAYISSSFGKFSGFIANSLLWFGFGAGGDAAIANALTSMMATYYAPLQLPYLRMIFMVFIFLGIALVNIVGIKYGIALIKLAAAVKLIPLLFFIVFGLPEISYENIALEGFPPLKNIGEASILLFFAFAGGEAALSVSGEIKEPSKTIPRGVIMGITVVIIFFILIQTITQGILGDELGNHSEAPLAAAANKFGGNAGANVLIVGAIISIFGALGSSIMSNPRLVFAEAKRGIFPAFLGQLHPRYSTPMWSIVFYVFVGLILSIFGGFEVLAVLSSATLLMVYLGVVLAAIKHRLVNKNLQDSSFNIPGGLTIHILTVIAICWFLIHLSFNEWIAITIALLVLAFIYAAHKYWSRDPQQT